MERDLLNDGYTDAAGEPLPPDRRPRFNGSVELKWAMPRNTSATWVFTLRDAGDAPATVEALEPEGRVLRIHEADGRELLVMLDDRPFSWEGAGLRFAGSVGLAVREDGAWTLHPIRARQLELLAE